MGEVMKKIIAALLTAALALTALPASAEYVNRQTGPFDGSDGYYLPDWWDIEFIEVYDDTEDPEKFVVAVRFAGWPLQSQFWLSGYMIVTLDVDGDLENDYALPTPDDIYPYDLGSLNLEVFDIKRQEFVSGCEGLTWMADGYDSADDFVVFEFNKSCIPLGATVNISAGIDSETGYFDFYDWATFQTGVAQKPKVQLGLPSAPQGQATATSNPSAAPANLTNMAASVLSSVVQVNCASGSGSGWAAKANLSSQQQALGYQSVIVTNNHVLEDCVRSGQVEVVLNGGATVEGTIFATDRENDLAGVLIKSSIPALTWNGDSPQQGWWVGVLGSPLSQTGYLTTGIISKTGAFGDFYATSAALNPGNSGGPVFDRTGRVLGTATAKANNSEGIGLWVTAPDLCQAVFTCSTGAAGIWVAGLVATNPEPGAGAGTQQPAAESAPTVKLSSKNFSFPKFAGRSIVLSAAQKAKIADVIAQIPASQKFVCTSVITDDTSRANSILYRKRAKAMCDYAKSLNPNLSTWFQSKRSVKRNAEGMLLITVKY